MYTYFCAKRDTLRCTNYILTLEKFKCLLLCKQVPNFTYILYILQICMWINFKFKVTLEINSCQLFLLVWFPRNMSIREHFKFKMKMRTKKFCSHHELYNTCIRHLLVSLIHSRKILRIHVYINSASVLNCQDRKKHIHVGTGFVLTIFFILKE